MPYIIFRSDNDEDIELQLNVLENACADSGGLIESVMWEPTTNGGHAVMVHVLGGSGIGMRYRTLLSIAQKHRNSGSR